MNKDYVSYELAVKLKACGFDEPCDYYYENGGTDILYTGCRYYNESGSYHSAPLLFHAQKWLREKHHISVRVSYIAYHKVWFADWLNLDSEEFDDTDATFATYEGALADGISAALDLIKKGE